MPSVTDNFAIVLKAVSKWDAETLQKAGTGLRRGLLYTVGFIQRKYLSGPRGPSTLQNISGRLRNSLTLKTDVNDTAGEEKITGTIGSNVKYAAFHEFGFHGTENVRAHTRVIGQQNHVGNEFDGRREVRTSSGQLVGFKETRKGASGRQRSGVVFVQFVKAHQRKVDYAGRPFVRPGLRQCFPVILEEISKELKS